MRRADRVVLGPSVDPRRDQRESHRPRAELVGDRECIFVARHEEGPVGLARSGGSGAPPRGSPSASAGRCRWSTPRRRWRARSETARRTREQGRSAAAWMAPSTPPPPRIARLAALTIASTSWVVMSPSTTLSSTTYSLSGVRVGPHQLEHRTARVRDRGDPAVGRVLGRVLHRAAEASLTFAQAASVSSTAK